MSTDDIETHASSEGTDAGAPLIRDITADTTPDGKPIYHGPDAWKRAAQEVAERTEADPDTFKSRGQEPRITADDIERGPVIKHHFKNKEPISVAEAARELVQQQELRRDPEYDRRVNLLDKLVEAGSDREEAEVDYRNAILEAEQRMAARRIGLYDEAPAEQQPEPAEQAAEPIQQQQPAQEPAQPGIRLPEIEAKAAHIAQQYIAEFGVQRALTSEEIATLTPEPREQSLQLRAGRPGRPDVRPHATSKPRAAQNVPPQKQDPRCIATPGVSPTWGVYRRTGGPTSRYVATDG